MTRATTAVFACLLAGCSLQSALHADGGTTSSSDEESSSAAGDEGDEGDEALPTGGEDSTTEPLPVTGCEGLDVRVAAYNVETVGPPGTSEQSALAEVLTRIDADVVCLEEVLEDENASLLALGAATGYDRVVQAEHSPAIGGDDTNACLSRVPLELVGSWGTWPLSSDEDANDTGRDLLVVRAFVGAPVDRACYLGLVSVHLKSGQEPADWFRRQVEIERVRQALARYAEMYPDDAIVVLGDFNENPEDPALGTVFEVPPADLPESYDLGSDIVLPLTYEPFVSMQDEGLDPADATQEDSASAYATWSDEVRLDYIWARGAEIVDDEVYNACRDDGVDADPPGNFMPKAGDPLACGTSNAASDHFPVVADLRLP